MIRKYTVFLLFSALLFAGDAALVFCKDKPDYSSFLSPQHIVSSSGVWSYGFDVSVNISPDGKATASISNLKPKNAGAWAKLNVTAEVYKVRKVKEKNIIRAQVKINSSGKARAFSVPVVSMGDYSKYKWGAVSDEETTDEWKRLFILLLDEHPELEDVEEFEGTTTEVSQENDVPGDQGEEGGSGKFDIEAMDSTTLAASPGKPNTCRLKVIVARSVKNENGKAIVRPAVGARVTFEKPAWGGLSQKEAVTDANGEAIVVYRAPAEEELKDKDRVSVDITARGENPGEYDYVPVSVENTSGKIMTEVEHEILPSISEYYSRITFKFRGEDKEYDVIVSIKQKDGALVTKRGEKGGTNRLEMKIRPGGTNEVFYHWTGARELTSARDDIVSIEIPGLELKKELQISVGIDLQPLRVENNWQGAAFPGVYHPFKVYVNDGFHPEADAAELFRKFHFRADLKMNQEYYEPVTIYDPDKESWLSRLISHMEGAVMPRGALTNSVINAKLEKGGQGDAFLIYEDWKEEKSMEASLPGAIPYDRGSYQFGFVLSCEDDANEDNNKILSQVINVEEYSAGGEMLNEFLVPTMKSYASMVPESGLVLYAIDTGVNLKEGNYTEAVVDTALQVGSDVAGDWIDTKRMEILEKPFKKIVAKATGKPVSKLSKEELKYCLKRAKEQYAGDLGGVIANWTMEKAKDEFMAKGMREKTAQDQQPAGWEFLRLFLKGYGDYGLVILDKKGLDDYKIYDQAGNELKNAPAQIFSGPAEDQRIFDKKEVVAVPFMLGENIEIHAAGTGEPGEIITITPRGITKREYPGKKWQTKIQVAEEVEKSLDISGKWKSRFGTIELSQSGGRVEGDYTHDSGRITGELDGVTLRGTWSEGPTYEPPKDAGDMEFVFSDDGRSFSGKWRYGHDKESWDGSWDGTKI